MKEVAGRVYNIGGGSQNTMSIWSEFGAHLEELFGEAIPVHHADWRPGDQPVYISDIRKAKLELNRSSGYFCSGRCESSVRMDAEL